MAALAVAMAASVAASIVVALATVAEALPSNISYKISIRAARICLILAIINNMFRYCSSGDLKFEQPCSNYRNLYPVRVRSFHFTEK